MNTYEAYKNKEFDLAAFGLDRCGGDYAYFCTPVGANVFASPGVDGIHYCMIEGFGEFDSDSFDVVYDAWKEDRNAQRNQPEGYADGLEPYF